MAVWSNVALTEIHHNFGRLDAEFFRPEFIETERLLRKVSGVSLRKATSKIDVGHVGSMTQHYRKRGITLLQTQNVKEFFVDLNHNVQITKEFHEKLRKSQVHTGNILIARSGSFGVAAIYLEDAVINSADIIIVELEHPRINPLFAVTFMNSQHGKAQLIRFASGGVQGHVNLQILESFRIPLLSDDDQMAIASKVSSAYAARKDGERAYSKAQQLLEETLQLDRFNHSKELGYEARFSTIQRSHRLDAQHFQPQFDALVTHLERFTVAKMRNIRTVNRRGVQPIYIKKGDIPVVNSQHLGRHHIAYDMLERTSKALFLSSPEAHILDNDLLIYSTGAYVGRTNIYLDSSLALASNHVTILRLIPEIDAGYLCLVMQSMIGQLQTQKYLRGSTQAELYPSDIDKFVIPLVAPNIQKNIGDLIRESLICQRDSKRLLEEAKTQTEELVNQAAI